MRRPVDLSPASTPEHAAVLDRRSDEASSANQLDWDAVQGAAIAAAEAVAAAAAADVACEAAVTAQAAVDAARAAAARAAARARQVASDAAEVVASAVTAQRFGLDPAVVVQPGPPARLGTGSPGGPLARYRHDAAAAATPCVEAQRIAKRVEAVADAAVVAAVDAALVVAAQLNADVAAAAEQITSARQRRQASNDLMGGVPDLLEGAAGPAVAAVAAVAAVTAVAAVAAVAATTIAKMGAQGASSNTIAAALNAGGSRTDRQRRWTAASVAKVLDRPAPPHPGLVNNPGRLALTAADLLALAEGACQRAEAGLEEAQRLGGLGSWSWSVATDELVWSAQMYRLFGADPATFDATYDGFLACVHPDDREHVSAAVTSVFEGRLGYECDYRVLHPDGNELWLHARGAVVRDEDGATVRMFGTVIDKTSAKLAEQRDQQHCLDLARLALHDSLTGLPNRRLLHNRLTTALTRRGQTVNVLLLDLDDFKAVNDTAGHNAGDQLLVEVGARLVQTARGSDTVARLGGDEFAIVTDSDDPWQLAERILDALDVPVLIGGRQVVPTASIGIASPDGSTDVEQLLVQADVAMYQAKAAGKSRIARFDLAMADKILLRSNLLDGLREAVRRGEIVVHYQPIMSTGTESMSRVEALVRWQRPEGLVPPVEFLPLAEDTGLIVEIGQDVLRQACEQLHGWLTADRGRSVSINVSPLQLLAGDFADRTLEQIVKAGISPRQVVLEVTETLFLNTTPVLIEQLDRLRRHGIKVSIDDFGTGYSSLGRLHTLPIDSLKIDKSFVDLIQTGNEGLPIVKSMIVMAHALGLDVTAEGVETAAQASCLIGLGCDYLQGFYFARPSHIEAATGPAADAAVAAWCELVPAEQDRR